MAKHRTAGRPPRPQTECAWDLGAMKGRSFEHREPSLPRCGTFTETGARRGGPRRWLKVLGILLAALLVLAAGAGAYFYLRADRALGAIERQDLLPVDDLGPLKAPGRGDTPTPLNILLLGNDSRGAGDIGRSDTIMLMHLPATRDKVYLLSFPRDLFVHIPNVGEAKINLAYSEGGPKLTVATVNTLLNTRVDHVAMVNFDNFVNLVATLGAITIDNPFEGCDDSQKKCWKAGKQELTYENALYYVRWRHGLPNGDVSRTQNQQRVVRAIMAKVLSAGTLADPLKLTSLLEETSKNVVVDQELSNAAIRDLAMSLRITHGSDIRSLTAPIKGYLQDPWRGSLDLVDETKLAELTKDLANDDLEKYWETHKNDPVAGVDTAPSAPLPPPVIPTPGAGAWSRAELYG